MERGENSPSRILSQRTMALMYDWLARLVLLFDREIVESKHHVL